MMMDTVQKFLSCSSEGVLMTLDTQDLAPYLYFTQVWSNSNEEEQVLAESDRKKVKGE
jgi:hypothetical protein